MDVTHILVNIPQKLQKTYNIGEKIGIKVINSDKNGENNGQFIFLNNNGKKVKINALKFFGTNITMRLFPI